MAWFGRDARAPVEASTPEGDGESFKDAFEDVNFSPKRIEPAKSSNRFSRTNRSDRIPTVREMRRSGIPRAKRPQPKKCCQRCKACRRSICRFLRLACNPSALAIHWTQSLEPWVTQRVIVGFALLQMVVDSLVLYLFLKKPLMTDIDILPRRGVMVKWSPLCGVVFAFVGLHAACMRNVRTTRLYGLLLMGSIPMSVFAVFPLMSTRCCCRHPLEDPVQCEILWSFYLWDDAPPGKEFITVANDVSFQIARRLAGLGYIQMSDRLQLSAPAPPPAQRVHMSNENVYNLSLAHYFSIGTRGIRFVEANSNSHCVSTGMPRSQGAVWGTSRTCTIWDALMTAKTGSRPIPSCHWSEEAEGKYAVDWSPEPLTEILRTLSHLLARCALDEFCAVVEARLTNHTGEAQICSYDFPVVPHSDCRDPGLMCSSLCAYGRSEDAESVCNGSVPLTRSGMLSVWYSKDMAKAVPSMMDNQRVIEHAVDVCYSITRGMAFLLGVLDVLTFIMIILLKKWLRTRCGDHIPVTTQWEVRFSSSSSEEDNENFSVFGDGSGPTLTYRGESYRQSQAADDPPEDISFRRDSTDSRPSSLQGDALDATMGSDLSHVSFRRQSTESVDVVGASARSVGEGDAADAASETLEGGTAPPEAPNPEPHRGYFW